MIFKILLIYFYVFTPILSKSIPSNDHHKINVILFFSKLENHAELPAEPQPLKCLGLSEKAKIKHDAILNDEQAASNGKASEIPTCHELLRNSVMNLLHFCEEKLGMKTAVASVDPHHLTEAISNDEPEVPPELKADHVSERKARRKTYFCPNNKKKEETVPSFVTKPKHTEVFNIRVRKQAGKRGKRQDNPMNHEIADVVLSRHTDKKPWDVLDVASHVRYSFFNDALSNHTNNHRSNEIIEDVAQASHAGEPELQQQAIEEIGKVEKDPGLFQTVSSALSTLQESQSEGFIMVIFGGHFNTVSQPHSPLVQSIKHVIETTDPESTMIVLSASCPENPSTAEVNEVVIPEANPVAETLIPIYAKGPHSERFAECTDLDDIPLTVKNILKKNSEGNTKGTCFQ